MKEWCRWALAILGVSGLLPALLLYVSQSPYLLRWLYVWLALIGIFAVIGAVVAESEDREA